MMGQAPSIQRIQLWKFRNYRELSLSVNAPFIVLTGPNGAGKTNLLEAISFLTPGRGLRRASYEQVGWSHGPGDWTVSVHLQQDSLSTHIGTGLQISPDGLERKRRIHINQAPASGSDKLLDYVRLLWLTPAMDRLFAGPASDRRRFLDRLILASDPSHGKRVAAYERALSSRNRLLEQSKQDSRWLSSIENQIAELGVAIAITRHELVKQLQNYCVENDKQSPIFPNALLAIEGNFETILGRERLRPAIEIEEDFRATLFHNRGRDAAAKRTLDGPHRSDFNVIHQEKNIPAAHASTGEQKALLIRLILAHAQCMTQQDGRTPILLLDEITAHLDSTRRNALFEALNQLGGQTWMSGTDPALFNLSHQHAHLVMIDNGHIIDQ